MIKNAASHDSGKTVIPSKLAHDLSAVLASFRAPFENLLSAHPDIQEASSLHGAAVERLQGIIAQLRAHAAEEDGK